MIRSPLEQSAGLSKDPVPRRGPPRSRHMRAPPSSGSSWLLLASRGGSRATPQPSAGTLRHHNAQACARHASISRSEIRSLPMDLPPSLQEPRCGRGGSPAGRVAPAPFTHRRYPAVRVAAAGLGNPHSQAVARRRCGSGSRPSDRRAPAASARPRRAHLPLEGAKGRAPGFADLPERVERERGHVRPAVPPRAFRPSGRRRTATRAAGPLPRPATAVARALVLARLRPLPGRTACRAGAGSTGRGRRGRTPSTAPAHHAAAPGGCCLRRAGVEPAVGLRCRVEDRPPPAAPRRPRTRPRARPAAADACTRVQSPAVWMLGLVRGGWPARDAQPAAGRAPGRCPCGGRRTPAAAMRRHAAGRIGSRRGSFRCRTPRRPGQGGAVVHGRSTPRSERVPVPG
jgi:hypothetical protein